MGFGTNADEKLNTIYFSFSICCEIFEQFATPESCQWNEQCEIMLVKFFIGVSGGQIIKNKL